MILICVLLLVFVSLDLHAMDQEMVLKDQMSQKPKLSFGWIVGDMPRYLPRGITKFMRAKEGEGFPVWPIVCELLSPYIEGKKNTMLSFDVDSDVQRSIPAMHIDLYYNPLPVWGDTQDKNDAAILVWQRGMQEIYDELCNKKYPYMITTCFYESLYPEIDKCIRAYLSLCIGNRCCGEVKGYSPDNRWEGFGGKSQEYKSHFELEKSKLEERKAAKIFEKEIKKIKKVLLHYCILENRIKQGRGPWSSLMCIPELNFIVSNYLSFNSQQLYQIASTVVLDDEQPQ